MMIMKIKIAVVGIIACSVAFPSSAAVRLPHVFGNGMVLQQGQRIPVWGKADSGETVTVSFAGQQVSATAGADGRWRLDLAPLKACAKGSEFRVKGENEIVLRNVVVGEVWFCSGQSNMEFTMSAHRKVKDWEKEVAAANWPLIRHFNVKHKVSETPLDDVKAKWEPTTPETIPPQSAVAFFFGETLFKNIDVPIGLINCSWGGTGIAPWTPAAHPDDLWILQNQREYAQPYRDQPTVLWNGMVAGLVPYAIKGAIWYQGCHNMRSGDKYIDMTVALVRGWRREWGQGDFPYFLVQLAPYKYDDPKGTALPVMQEAQARIPSVVPNSGYTVINDVGNVDDVHPVDKRTVGMRIAHQVLDRVYGKFVRPWRTPIMKSCRAEGAALRVLFDNAEGLKTRDGLAPTEFELLADDGETWVPADAKIEGESVVLSAAGVASPRAMRFAAYNGSTPNLVNGAGLPAGPFRASASQDEDRLEVCRRIFEADIADGIVHGAAIVVGGLDGEPLSGAWGWADPAHERPMTTKTVIDIASVTKVAAGVTSFLVAHSRGMVDFDAPFTNYLSSFSAPLDRKISTRDLANHVSGFGEADGKPRVYLDADAGKMLANLLSMPPAKPKPGKVKYSCRNYILLGREFEALTGRRIDEFCRNEIFLPAGMSDTSIGAPLAGIPPERLAQTITTKGPGKISDYVARPLWQAHIGTFNAGMFSTAEDMAKLMRTYLRDGVCDGGARIFTEKETAEIAPRPGDRRNGARSFGWEYCNKFMPESFAGVSLSHSGWSGQTVLMDLRTKRYAVVLTTRCGDYVRAKRDRFSAISALLD